MTEASADLVKNQFKGPSYTGGNDADGDELGFNIAMFYMYGDKGYSGPSSPVGQHDRQLPSASLLASTGNHLSLGSAYAPPRPTTFFNNEHFALMPGVQLIRKGNKVSDSFGTDVTHLLYLEIPVYALYRHYLPDNKGELFGGLGPYFAYGLSGNFKSTFNGQTSSFPAFGGNGGFKRFDAGLALTAGYQFPNSLRIRLGYELGLTNIESGPSGPDDDKAYNRAISLNVGYPLAKIVDKFKKK
ncbi:hypothetical protein GCM10028808_31830 [Spirosoma migulaei]